MRIDARKSCIAGVASYISRSASMELPKEVAREAKHHILDSLAAIVSGSGLKPGQLAKNYVESQKGVEEAHVVSSSRIHSAINAAFAHGIMGHADETDDQHASSRNHPGCAIIPAALAAAERQKSGGSGFLKGVVVGYDIACRMNPAIGLTRGLRGSAISSHGIGGSFGAAAGAASVMRLKEDQVRYALSYTAQQASGIRSWVRDQEHVEKAFVFGGMPARNGVTACLLVQSGFTGVDDVFSGENNFFNAFSPDPKPELLTEELGTRYEILFTHIKKFPIGSPIQAAMQALFQLMERHVLKASEVKSIEVRLSNYGVSVVDNRSISDINLQHIMALALIDRGLTFASAHSYERMKDPSLLALKERIKLVADPDLRSDTAWSPGIVEITTQDGGRFNARVEHVRGMVENPMTTEEVVDKCRDLLTPVLGDARSARLIERILDLERVKNVSEVGEILSRD